MVTVVPDYYEQFQCLAGACPHSCCEKWEVVIDEDHACWYRQVEGTLGDKLRAALGCDAQGDHCFPLNGGRCPFLDEENLCEIHRRLGEEATSVTCQEHPRFIEDYGPFREVTLSASCPAANALLLGSEAPLAFREMATGEPEEAGDAWLAYLLPLRQRMLAILKDRTRPLRGRLGQFLLLAAEAQWRLEEELEDTLPALAETWQAEAEIPAGEGTELMPAALELLASLEALDPDWRDLLRRAEKAEGAAVSEDLLERIAVYFAFRYLLKCVNDGDLLSRAQLCVLAVLVIERLAAVCGLEEALRRFSCEIEHSDVNVEALQTALYREEAFSPRRFLAALDG